MGPWVRIPPSPPTVEDDKMTLNIEWRTREGLGDFITGLGYAHSSVMKYQQPVHINFHWPNPKDTLISSIDKESINYRFDYILGLLRPVEGLTISHTYSSAPTWRFINEFEEFNPLHGLWYPKDQLTTEKGLVVQWSSKHNLSFPGYGKDPLYDHWDQIVRNLKAEGYNVVEVTYRTPIKEIMDVMMRCEFGIGYEGMVHQFFKFLWKPLIVGVSKKRWNLANLLCVQAHLIDNPNDLLYGDVRPLVNISREKISRLLIDHQHYINDTQDPTQHRLYNIPT